MAKTSKLPLYPQLPELSCEKGCGKCCGPALASRSEFRAIKEHILAHGIIPQKNGLRCPFFQDRQCAIYPVRPMICRMFGHHRSLTCEKGHNVNISDEQEEQIMSSYLTKYSPTYILHSFVYSDAEIMELIDPGELSATEKEILEVAGKS